MECESHAGENVLMICSTCEGELLCAKCAINGFHNGHDVKDINKLGENVKTRLKTLVDGEDDSEDSQLGKEIKDIGECLTISNRTSQKVCDAIDRRCEILKCEIDEIGEKLKTKCRDYHDKNKKALEERQGDMKACLNDCTRVIGTGNAADQVKTLRRTQQLLKKKNPTFDNKSMSFIVGTGGQVELQNMIGELKTGDREVDDKNYVGSICRSASNEVSELSPTSPCGEVGEFSPTLKEEEGEYEECGSDIYRRKSFYQARSLLQSFQHSETVGVSLIVPNVSDKENSWVKCQQEREIRLVSDQGKVIKSIVFDNRIRGMDMTSDGTLFVASHQSKSIWKVFQDGSVMKKEKAFNTGNLMPYHVCADKNNDLLVTLMDVDSFELTDKSRRIVARYNTKGKMLGYAEHDDRGKRLFVTPDKVRVDQSSGDIIVINRMSRNSRHLVVLDSQLKLKFRHLSEGTIIPREEQYTEPEVKASVRKFIAADLCTDPKGNILMVVPHRNSVYLFNNAFVYQSTMDKGEDSPWSIALQSGKLWVGYKSGKVSIFEY